MKLLIIKGKRGSLPVTLLVIGIFAVCAFALLTFFISDLETSNSFVGVDIVQKINSQIDEYKFYKKQGVSEDFLNSFFDFRNEGKGVKYFYGEKKGGSSIFGGEEEFLFSVEYPVQS